MKRFESGLWFHYFSSIDQRSHMFMRVRGQGPPLL